jgi:hypothetical protein
LGEGGGHLQCRFWFAKVDGPADDCANVVQLLVQGFQPGSLIRSSKVLGGLLGEIQENAACRAYLGLYRGFEPFSGVL